MQKFFGSGLTILLLSALAILPGCQSPAGNTPPPNRDEAEIRATLTALNAHCAKKDLPAFMALFDDSEDIMLIGSDKGEIAHGHKEIQEFIGMLFSFKFTFSFDLQNVIIKTNGDSAWVFVDGNMIRTGATGKQSLTPYRISLTLVKRAGHWRWQLFNGSIPRGE